MNKKRKWTSLFLVSSLVLVSACSGNGNNEPSHSATNAQASESPASNESAAPAEQPDPFGRYPETVEFTVVRATSNNPAFPEGQSYEDNLFNKFIEEQLNVKPKYQWMAPQDGFAYKKKLDLAINGNDIPDMFMIMGANLTDTLQTVKHLVDADMIEDLTDVYNQYASPEIKEAYASENNKVLDLFKINGKQYGIPGQNTLENFNFVWVREDWRKQLNLPEPKTLEDVVAIAKAFKEKDPAGGGKTVPIAMQMEREANGLFGPGFIFDNFNSYTDLFYKDENGELVFGGIQPEIKDGLKVLHQMYEDGLIEQDFVMKDTGKLQELLASGRAGIVGQAWWGVWYPLFMTMQNNPDADWKPYVIPSAANGKINYGTTMPVGAVLVVKKGFEHPELAMKWLNVYNANKDSEQFIEWQQNEFKDANDKSPILFGVGVTPTNDVNEQAKRIVGAVDGTVDPSTLPAKNLDAYNHIKKFMNELKDQPQTAANNTLQWQNTRSWYDAMGQAAKYEMNIVYSAFDGTTPTMDKKLTALKDLQIKQYHNMIIKSKDIDADFDKFVADWKAQGGDEILAEIKAELEK